MREKCMCSEFFWSVFPALRLNTERYGVIRTPFVQGLLLPPGHSFLVVSFFISLLFCNCFLSVPGLFLIVRAAVFFSLINMRVHFFQNNQKVTLHKKQSFSLRISSVNVKETAYFVIFTEEALNLKIVQWKFALISEFKINSLHVPLELCKLQ